ncbi:TIGR00725 family protein [Candidatus Neomarinimicrobiota bacterium]
MNSYRPPIIGVMGGGQVSPEIANLAHELGQALASEGWVVLSGGRNAGVMAAVSEGAALAGGLVVGILPDRDLSRASHYLTIPIRTGLGDGRNILNILSSDVVVALPGGAGTLSEIALALKNRKPLLLLGWQEHPIKSPELEAAVCGSVSEVIDRIRELQGGTEKQP